MKNLIILIILLVCIISNISCVSTKELLKDLSNFKLSFMDTTTFKDYNMFFLKKNSKFYYLLSIKADSVKIKGNKENYETMNVGKMYKLKLYLIDTIKVLKIKDKGSHMGGYVNGKELIWLEDTLRTKVFMTEQILDRFVKVEQQ